MKTTGIVRRMDELGRVVIPKEIRKTYRIKEGDPIEICVNDNGELTIKKHSPIKDVTNIVIAYAEALSSTSGLTVLIADNDSIIAAAGENKKEYLSKQINSDLYKVFLGRKAVILSKDRGDTLMPIKFDEIPEFACQAIVPVLNFGDVFGAVILISYEKGKIFSQVEQLLASTAAAFIGTQLT